MANPVIPEQKVTELSENFKNQLNQLADLANKIHCAYLLCEQRPWMLPANWDGDLFALIDIALAFTKVEPNGQYYDALHDEPRGVLSDCIVTKAQVDYLSSLERSFRQRHMGHIRSAMHAASRKRGQGHEKGLYREKLPQYLKRVIKAGQNPAPTRPS